MRWLFLFREVLGRPFDGVKPARSRKTPRLPVVLSVDEVRSVLASLRGTNFLMVSML